MEAAPPPQIPGWMPALHRLSLALAVLGLGLWLLGVARQGDPLARGAATAPGSVSTGAWKAEGAGGRFRVAGDAVSALAWDLQGQRLAIGTRGGRTEVWEVSRGQREASFQAEGEVAALAFKPAETNSSGGSFSLYTLQGVFRDSGLEACQLLEWDGGSGLLVGRHGILGGRVSAAAFDAAGKRLALISGGSMEIWELEAMRASQTALETLCPASLAVSTASGYHAVLVGEQRGTVALFTASTARLGRKTFHEGIVRTAVSLDGCRAAAGFSPTLAKGRLTPRPIQFCDDWQKPDPPIRQLEGVPGDVRSLQFSGEYRLIAVCVSFIGETRPFDRLPILASWDLHTGKLLGTMELETATRLALASPDGTRLASASPGGEVLIQNILF